MLTPIEKLLFLLIATLSLALSFRNFSLVFQIVRRGRPDLAFDGLRQRIRHALQVYLTQYTVLRSRPVVSLLHTLVAWSFTYYLFVNLGDVLEGFIPNFRFSKILDFV